MGTASSPPQDFNQEMLKNVSARDIKTGDNTQIINNYNYPAPPPLLTSTPSNIPYLGASTFVGRREELEQIHQFLQQNVQVAVSAIAGMGGVGKTELAVQYTRIYQNDYSAGQGWFSARAANLGAQILDFAAGLQLVPPELPDINLRIAYIWQHWPVCPATTSNKEESGDVLLVFDDVENYEQVQPFLPLGLPRFKVLITSRNELGRNVHHIPLDVLPLEKALELLKSFISQRVETEEQSANELCAWLGRLPLGIELVGQYLADRKAITLAKMLEQLKSQKLSDSSLQRDERDPDNSSFTARRGVAAAFELSWNTLNDEQKELGCLLSLFAPAAIGWSLVEKVIGQSREQRILNAESQEKARIRLVKSHLLQSAEDGQSFRLHPLLREFFQEKLEFLGDTDDLKRAYCQVLVVEAQQIPLEPTREVVEKVLPVIPHLAEVATTLHRWVEDENLFRPFVGLGSFYAGQGAYTQAQPWLEQCLAVCRERFEEEHPTVASCLNNLAYLYSSQGKYDQAEPLYKQALEMRKRLLGEEDLDVASSLNNLAGFYCSHGRYEYSQGYYEYSQGCYEQAELLHKRALAIREKLLGQENYYVGNSLNNLALLYSNQDKCDQAEPLYERALAIFEKELRPEHPDVAASLNNLGLLYSNQGKYAQAEPLLERALAILQKELGPEHPKVAQTLDNQAGLYYSQGRYEYSQGRYKQAELLFKRTLAIWEKVLGLEHLDVAAILINLMGLYSNQGRYEQAEPLLKRALAILEKVHGSEHPNTITVRQNYMTLLSELPKRRKPKGFKPS